MTTSQPAPTKANALEYKDGSETRRLHLSGFRTPVTADDIHSRFTSFGVVAQIEIPDSETGHVRGFVHFSLTTTLPQFTKLFSLYNNTQWKGGTISIQFAKRASYTDRQSALKHPASSQRMDLIGGWRATEIAARRAAFKSLNGALRGKHARHIRQVVDDDLFDLKAHPLWKRVKFGRILPIFRKLRTPLGHITMDPTHSINAFVRLYLNAKPTPVHLLTWSLDTYHECSPFQSVSLDDGHAVQSAASEPSVDYPSLFQPLDYNEGSRFQPEDESDCSLSLPDKEAHGKESQELGSSNEDHTAGFNLFADTEMDLDSADDSDMMGKFDVKHQFMGAKGKEMLKLHQKSKGDDRFTITQDFAPDSSDCDDPARTSTHDPHDPTANVQEERNMALSLLSKMFGADVTRDAVDHARIQSRTLLPPSTHTSQNRTAELTGIVFYDPEAEGRDQYEYKDVSATTEVSPDDGPRRNTETLAASMESEDSESSEADEPVVPPPRVTNKNPALAAVNTDFGSIFTPSGPSADVSSFALFGPAPPAHSCASVPVVQPSVPVETAPKQNMSLMSRHFFITAKHLDQSETKLFAQTMTDDEVFKKWHESRRDTVADLRLRHKNAVRKKVRRAGKHSELKHMP